MPHLSHSVTHGQPGQGRQAIAADAKAGNRYYRVDNPCIASASPTLPCSGNACTLAYKVYTTSVVSGSLIRGAQQGGQGQLG